MTLVGVVYNHTAECFLSEMEIIFFPKKKHINETRTRFCELELPRRDPDGFVSVQGRASPRGTLLSPPFVLRHS